MDPVAKPDAMPGLLHKGKHKAIIRTLDGLERVETFLEQPSRYIEVLMAYSRQKVMFPRRRYEHTREKINGIPVYLETES